MPVIYRYLRHVLHAWSVRAGAAALVLLLAAALAVAARPHRAADISLQTLRQELRTEGVALTPAETLHMPVLRGVQPQRFDIGSATSTDTVSLRTEETVAVYIFASPAERSRGEDELRALSGRSAAQLPIFYRRSNAMLLYWPLVIVNQSGTRYGGLLQQALDKAAATPSP